MCIHTSCLGCALRCLQAVRTSTLPANRGLFPPFSYLDTYFYKTTPSGTSNDVCRVFQRDANERIIEGRSPARWLHLRNVM